MYSLPHGKNIYTDAIKHQNQRTSKTAQHQTRWRLMFVEFWTKYLSGEMLESWRLGCNRKMVYLGNAKKKWSFIWRNATDAKKSTLSWVTCLFSNYRRRILLLEFTNLVAWFIFILFRGFKSLRLKYNTLSITARYSNMLNNTVQTILKGTSRKHTRIRSNLVASENKIFTYQKLRNFCALIIFLQVKLQSL